MAVDDQYTVSLQHFDGNLNDESGKVWTTYGGAAFSTTRSKFGSGSLYLPSSSASYLSIPKTTLPLSGNFTFETWLYLTDSSSGTQTIFGDSNNSSTTSMSLDVVAENDHILFRVGYGGDFVINVQSAATVTSYLNSWIHIAVARSEILYYFFINGSLVGNGAASATNAGQDYWFIGSGIYGKFPLRNAYVDEVRFSAVPRYLGAFTPQAAPFAAQNLWLPQPQIFF